MAIGSLVIWRSWPAHQKEEILDLNQMKRREAMAFVLGWQSKMMLVQTIPDRPMRFYLMNLYMEQLGVRLPQPLEYYMNDAGQDQGARAQAFAEETLKQLSGNREIANHFAIASNILLAIASHEAGHSARDVKVELGVLVGVLDVPANLKNVPMTHLSDWAVEIERYFESRLADDPGENSAGRDNKNISMHVPLSRSYERSFDWICFRSGRRL